MIILIEIRKKVAFDKSCILQDHLPICLRVVACSISAMLARPLKLTAPITKHANYLKRLTHFNFSIDS